MKRAIDTYSLSITVNSAGGKSTDINLPGRGSIAGVMDMAQTIIEHLHSASSFMLTIVHHVEFVEEDASFESHEV